MDREDFAIEIIIINKNKDSSYKKNSENTSWTLEEEAQIKYYKFISPTKKKLSWKDIGFILNKSPSLVKKIWHCIIEKEHINMSFDNVSTCKLCGRIHF